MYHYVDPQGREQGPFAYAHLAKWFKAGYLRPNLGCRRQDETTYARTVTQALLEDGAMHGVPEHMLGEVVRPTTAARTGGEGGDDGERGRRRRRRRRRRASEGRRKTSRSAWNV